MLVEFDCTRTISECVLVAYANTSVTQDMKIRIITGEQSASGWCPLRCVTKSSGDMTIDDDEDHFYFCSFFIRFVLFRGFLRLRLIFVMVLAALGTWIVLICFAPFVCRTEIACDNNNSQQTNEFVTLRRVRAACVLTSMCWRPHPHRGADSAPASASTTRDTFPNLPAARSVGFAAINSKFLSFHAPDRCRNLLSRRPRRFCRIASLLRYSECQRWIEPLCFVCICLCGRANDVFCIIIVADRAHREHIGIAKCVTLKYRFRRVANSNSFDRKFSIRRTHSPLAPL